MEKGNVTAISVNNNSIKIDENWHGLADNVKMSYVKRGPCEYKLNDNNEVSYIKSEGKGRPGPNLKQKSDDSIEQMSKLKNKVNARMSALTNATNLQIARAQIEKGSTDPKQILNIAKEFLEFIEK